MAKKIDAVLSHSRIVDDDDDSGDGGSNNVRRQEFAYAIAVYGPVVQLDARIWGWCFSLWFALVWHFVAATLIVHVLIRNCFLCVCVDLCCFFFIYSPAMWCRTRLTERERASKREEVTEKRVSTVVMYDEMMMMMMLKSCPIVVTNNNCFRIILFTLSQTKTKFPTTTNRLNVRCTFSRSALCACICVVRVWIYASFIR